MRETVAASSKFLLLLGSGLSSGKSLYVNAYGSDSRERKGEKDFFNDTFPGSFDTFQAKNDLCA